MEGLPNTLEVTQVADVYPLIFALTPAPLVAENPGPDRSLPWCFHTTEALVLGIADMVACAYGRHL